MEHLEEIEKRLWSSADNLRANSNFASNEYFLPVMGLIFLRHAYSRFLKVKAEIEPSLPRRGGKRRALTKEDFSRKGAIFLHSEAQFDHLVSLPDSADRAQVMIDAMEQIERDYETLRGALPKAEYQELDNDVLGQLLRTFNDPALRRADGDVFGRIYEYFLTQFADQKAHDGGEFFTPVALVQTIVNVIEPDHGRVLDPACGSGGMFVQSAHFIERMHLDPTERATFFGMEKNPTTIRLANMNLAVHGLEGNIHKAITYYEDPHELLGTCDFVMANPPFNVDEVDAEKVKNDPRLPYALPGVNKKGKVSNGNYLWISYFDSYLNNTGRAGFVMSSQASSAGGEEAKVRRKLIEAGHLDVMMAIRSGFFYTRTVPCELWFLDKAKPAELREKVLMIDARNVHRKVTRKIYDFTPEQQKNLAAIVWLYRGQNERFLALVAEHLERMVEAAGEAATPVRRLAAALAAAATTCADGELFRRPRTEPHGVRRRAGGVRARPGRLRVGGGRYPRCMGLVPPRQRRAHGVRRTRPALGRSRARPDPPGRSSPQAAVARGRGAKERPQQPAQGGRRSAQRRGRASQCAALLLAAGALASGAVPGRGPARRRRAREAGRPRRAGRQRLEPDTGALCRRGAGGGRRGFRLRADDAGHPRGAR